MASVFAVETIPDEAILFRRIHHMHFLPDGKISSQAYDRERLSVNWEKYSDPESTADADSAAVTALVCGACRKLKQDVEHVPIDPDQPFGPNQAHAEICGKKPRPIRQQLRDIAQTVWSKLPD
jgi:hypothetical protein